ncbi:MAG: hypothetical protein RIS69_1025 [Actinomycetota bacterium]
MTTHTIALVAHDQWAKNNKERLSRHSLVATGTTGRMLIEMVGLDVKCLKSGPLGGDQQLGAMICEQQVDMLIFFWDPLEPQPHDPRLSLSRMIQMFGPYCASLLCMTFRRQAICQRPIV